MERLFDTVETFYGPEIPAGEQWLSMIEKELSNTDFGIICITKANQKQQWLNYEDGALSRQVTDRRKRVWASFFWTLKTRTTWTARSKTSR